MTLCELLSANHFVFIYGNDYNFSYLFIYLIGILHHTQQCFTHGQYYGERKPGSTRGKPVTIRRLLCTFPPMAGEETSLSFTHSYHNGGRLQGHCALLFTLPRDLFFLLTAYNPEKAQKNQTCTTLML